MQSCLIERREPKQARNDRSAYLDYYPIYCKQMYEL